MRSTVNIKHNFKTAAASPHFSFIPALHIIYALLTNDPVYACGPDPAKLQK
jgi:hypothetical protein